MKKVSPLTIRAPNYLRLIWQGCICADQKISHIRHLSP